jgi:hypothetical protein
VEGVRGLNGPAAIPNESLKVRGPRFDGSLLPAAIGPRSATDPSKVAVYSLTGSAGLLFPIEYIFLGVTKSGHGVRADA